MTIDTRYKRHYKSCKIFKGRYIKKNYDNLVTRDFFLNNFLRRPRVEIVK